MRTIFHWKSLSILSVFFFCASMFPCFAQEKALSQGVQCKIPCLTVNGENTGKLSYLPMEITRRDSDAPLKVMFVDDTPNGSGQDIHSSVWMAVVTAALLRNDTMRGVTISVEFSGNVDGPSAGGVTCLSILSALDGLELPSDFAMTGTILPDGTIGMVGGVPAKMRAAASGGVKRIFVPSYQRIYEEQDGEKTIEVDLQQLGDELGVELFFVDNIQDAYCILHNKALPRNEYRNIKQIMRLPKEIESVLSKWYNIYRGQVQEYMKKATPEDLKRYVCDGFSFSPSVAEGLYREGKLLPAVIQMYCCLQCWRGNEEAAPFVKDCQTKIDLAAIGPYLQEFHLRKYVTERRVALENYWKKYSEAQGVLKNAFREEYFSFLPETDGSGFHPNSAQETEFAAQLEPIVLDGLLRAEGQELLSLRIPPEQLNRASRDELLNACLLEDDLVLIWTLIEQNDRDFMDFLIELGQALPKLRGNAQAKDVERLFYASAQAIGVVAHGDFAYSMETRNASGNASSSSNPECLPLLEQFNALYDQMGYCHFAMSEENERPLTNSDYHLQSTLKCDIAFFSLASAFSVLYSSSSASSNEFLAQLLRNARETAITNIAECVKAGIPCVAPIYDFESAEAQQQQDIRSSYYALIAYWRASLYAKALLMSFQK